MDFKGGKLHESVKENMEANGMLKKSSDLANQMRKSGTVYILEQ